MYMNLTHIIAGVVDYSSLPKQSGDTTQQVLNIVFGVSASIALLMIVISGFRYIVANGDPNSVSSAKRGILYAVIGLIVVLAAYSIVTFVINGIS